MHAQPVEPNDRSLGDSFRHSFGAVWWRRGRLVQWEVTIGEALSDAGYATGYYGKRHLGSHDGRLPNDQGFDEWFGIPRTTDESLWPSSPGLVRGHHARGADDGRPKGEKSASLGVYDVTQRRLIDADITAGQSFIERQTNSGRPFFAYVALTQPHLPRAGEPGLQGQDRQRRLGGHARRNGCQRRPDARCGGQSWRRENTIVIFCATITAPFFRPWDGWAGLGADSTSPPWRVAFACPS